MPATLTIGDFARATHLSVKALRHYHRIGLLVPAEVDRPSGYRHYATEQISTAHIIRRFRDLDMPLDEIADVVATDDLDARNQLITSHLDRLEQALGTTQSAVRSLRDLLGSSTPPSIELRSVAATRAAAITAIVDAAEFGPWFRGAFGELDATLAASGVRPGGAGGRPVRHRPVRPRARDGDGVRAGRPHRSTTSVGSASSRSRPRTSP